MSQTARAVRYSLVVVALILTGFNGIVEGLNATHFADTPGMKVATATQLLYGLSAAAAFVAMAVRRQLVFPILAVWSLALTGTAVLAPVVYAGRTLGVGVIVGAVVALVTGLLLWAWPPAARDNYRSGDLMATPRSPTAGKSRVLFWAGAACIGFAWIAEIAAAALGKATAWPNWLMLVAVSGLLASHVLRPARPKASVYLVIAMAVLSVVAIVGIAARL